MATRRRAVTTHDVIRTGRDGPSYTDVHDWVGLAEVSPEAHSLYGKLRMHVNRSRADDMAWPGKERLAVMMRVKRGDYIDEWLGELEALGAIEVAVARTMPKRNVYLVHKLPPAGYTGPTNLVEWAAKYDTVVAERKAAAQEKTRLARERRAEKAQVGAVTGPDRVQNSGPPVTGEDRVQVTGQGREHVPAQGRVEPDVVEPDEGNQPPTPATLARRSPPGPAQPGGESSPPTIQTDPALVALVDEVKATAPDWRYVRQNVESVLAEVGRWADPPAFPVTRLALLALARGQYGPTASVKRLTAMGPTAPWWVDAEAEHARATQPAPAPSAPRLTALAAYEQRAQAAARCDRCDWNGYLEAGDVCDHTPDLVTA